jgi:hypothetical protein
MTRGIDGDILPRQMGEVPSSPAEDAPTLRGAWSRLRSRTPSKTLPQILLAFFYGWLVLWHSQLADDAASAIAVIPPIAAALWFYGIVLWRLAVAAPLGRSLLQSAGNLWVLFLGYTIWLGFFPPTGDKSAFDWGAWVLVIAGLIALLIVLPPWR